MMIVFPPRTRLVLLGGYAAAALVAALTSQFGFGLHPCELCLMQRWPYVAIIGLTWLGALLGASGRAGFGVLLACLALFVADAGIAAYHAGVEWGIFEGLDSCSAGELPPHASLEDIRKQLMEAPVVSCKDTMFEFLGLSMAGWNVFYALGGGMLSVLALRTPGNKETA